MQQNERNKRYKSVREIIVEGLCDFLSDSDGGRNCTVIGNCWSYATNIKRWGNY